MQKIIQDRTPDQLKMPYALWTRQSVAEVIEQRFGIRVPVRTMGLYLSRWGGCVALRTMRRSGA
ncbi:hypothetical protein QFZ98_004457 [Paraburkholderia youngii]